jgi:hypothetical protein
LLESFRSGTSILATRQRLIKTRGIKRGVKVTSSLFDGEKRVIAVTAEFEVRVKDIDEPVSPSRLTVCD